MIPKKCACMLFVDIWVTEMKEKFEGRRVSLEARINNPGPGGAELDVQKPGLNRVRAAVSLISSDPEQQQTRIEPRVLPSIYI